MTIAGGIFLIAVGAILRYATNIEVQGINFDTVGLILMVAGAAGMVLGFGQEVMRARSRREEISLAERREAERYREQQQQQAYGDPQAYQDPQPRREPPRY